MSVAAVTAFAAAVCGVLAAWEAAAAVEHARVAAALGRLVAPLRRGVVAPTPQQDAERRRLAVVAGAVGLGGGTLTAGVVAGVACATVAAWGVGRVAAVRDERRRAELAAGAPAVARALAAALAAGRSIRGALTAAAEGGGCGEAADAELRDAAGALALGAPTDGVLERLRARAGGPAWDTIIAAVLLQRDAGGDLAGLLAAVAADLEATRRAAAEARTATAQARATARIVGGLPIGALLVAELAAPGTAGRMLSHPLSAVLLAGAATLQVLGVVLVRRIAPA